MDQTVVVYVSLAISVASSVLALINHKRIRSSCCGRKTEISLDIENTTPDNKKISLTDNGS